MSRTALPGLFFSALILTVSVGYSQAGGVSLDQAVGEALKGNPTIQAAKVQVDAASSWVLSSYLWPDPGFEVMWMGIPGGSFDPADAGTRQYALSQMIPFPGKQALKGSLAAAGKEKVDAQSRALIQQTLSKTENAYWASYRLSRDRVILAESVALLDQLLASARTRYATGNAPQAEVLSAQLARSELEVKLVALEEELDASRVELGLLMGRDTNDLPQLPSDIPIEYASAEDSFQASPKIEASRADVSMANRKLSSAWLDAAPDFMVAYRWRESQASDVSSSDIMLGVTLPVYVWPRTSNRITAAQAERKAATFTEQAVRNEVRTRFAKLSARLTSSREEIERIREEVLTLASQSLASARIAYETGAVEFVSLLRAEQSWRNARMSLEASRFRYQTALADLKALVGGYQIERE